MEKILGTTGSLCPECLKRIDAQLVEVDGKIKIRKSCSRHGIFEDTYWGDAGHYKWVNSFLRDGAKVDNPRTTRDHGCCRDCGLCNEHKTHTVLGIIDVTNRCNLRCPICFASSNTKKEVYEPTAKQVEEMLRNLRRNEPVPVHAFQFSGGEPTVRDDLADLIRIGKRLGFLYMMVNTNGIRIAEDIEYLRELQKAGLDSFYLQFDGVEDRVYKMLRGAPLLRKKEKAIRNCREIGLNNVVLVVTLAKGINEDQVGKVIDYAFENRDVVKCVNFQPLSFTGNASRKDIEEKRITIYDFIKLVEEQTDGRIKSEYFYPVTSTADISEFAESYTKRPTAKLSTHPCCGLGTYLVANGNGSYKPINEIINVDRFLGALRRGLDELEGVDNTRIPQLARMKAYAKVFIEAASCVNDPMIAGMLIDMIKNAGFENVMQFHDESIMIGCMHFMDPWNFDYDRVSRCAIHYSTPDGRLIPFCAYNAIHRQEVERKFYKKEEMLPETIPI